MKDFAQGVASAAALVIGAVLLLPQLVASRPWQLGACLGFILCVTGMLALYEWTHR